MRQAPSICYLCGRSLTLPTSADHVPPRQIYSKEVRKAHGPDLLTIPVHAECNRFYQHDEDYFVNTLAPFGRDSYAGASLLREVFSKYKAGEKRPLVHKVLQEFEHRPGGIHLPGDLIAKRIEGDRVHRVAWKIVRGLYFHAFGKVLPAYTPNSLEIVPPDHPPPEIFLRSLYDRPSQGGYPGAFDYKYVQIPELNDFNYWGLLLWDRLILIVAFHSPQCPYAHCQELRRGRTLRAT